MKPLTMLRPWAAALSALTVWMLLPGFAGAEAGSSPARARVAALADEVQAADYRADVPGLHELARQLEPLAADSAAGAWAHYWRGFAVWRSTINTVNGDPKNQRARADLLVAAADFERAAAEPALAADAHSARASCVLAHAFLSGDPSSFPAALEEYKRLIEAARAAGPDNPRMLWIYGWYLYYGQPPKAGPGASVAALRSALEAAKREQQAPRPLAAPRWGEAELLMALAWVESSRPDPKLAEADALAHQAQALVPDWHYLKAFLVPQIHTKMAAAEPPLSCPKATACEGAGSPARGAER